MRANTRRTRWGWRIKLFILLYINMIFTREQLQHMHETNAVFIQVLSDADERNECARHFVIYSSIWKSWEWDDKAFELECVATDSPAEVMEKIISASVFACTGYNGAERICKAKKIAPKE